MNETELERIVVRLVGDGSEYKRMLDEAAKKTDDAAKHVEQAAGRIEGFKNALTGFAGQAMSILGMFGVASSLKGAFDTFQKMEEGQIRLRNTIEATGQALGPTLAQYKQLVDSVTKNTLITKGEVFGMLQRATAMGLTADVAEKVVKNAIALAGATGQEAEGMLRATAAIERGNYQLARRQLGLQGVKDETELVRIVNNMMIGGMKTQEELAGTAAGKLERLGRSLKSVTMEIGGMATEAILPAVNTVKEMIEWFNKLDPATKKLAIGIVGVGLAIQPIISSVRLVSSLMFGWGTVIAGLATAAAALWVYFEGGAKSAMGTVKSLWEGITEVASEWKDYFKYLIDNFGAEWQRLSVRMTMYIFQGFQKIVEVWGLTVGLLKLAWNEFIAYMSKAGITAVRTVENFGRNMAQIFIDSPMFTAMLRMLGHSADSIRLTQRQMHAEMLNENRGMIAEIRRQQEEVEARRVRIQSQIAAEMASSGSSMTPQINALRRELDEMNSEFERRFGQFRIGERAREGAVRDATALGSNIGEAFTHGVKHEMGKLDAALNFSAEAASRLASYRDRILGTESPSSSPTSRGQQRAPNNWGWLNSPPPLLRFDRIFESQDTRETRTIRETMEGQIALNRMITVLGAISDHTRDAASSLSSGIIAPAGLTE